MYVYVCIYMCVYIYIYIYIYVLNYIITCVCINIYIYIHIYVYTHMCNNCTRLSKLVEGSTAVTLTVTVAATRSVIITIRLFHY